MDEPVTGRLSGEAGAQQVTRQAVIDLHESLDDRRGRLAVEQAHGADPAQRCVGGKPCEHGFRLPGVVGQQPGGEPRAREPPRDVIVQVAQQPAEPRVQLRRRAQGEHRDVEPFEAEQRAGRCDPVVDAVDGRPVRQREGGLV